MAKSNIEWTEVTWNPVTGCTKISPGCKNCYAEIMHHRLMSMGQKKYSKPFSEVVLHNDSIKEPLSWKKPKMIFVNSMSDLFHKDIPFTFIDSIFEVMGYCTQHTFQVLTKRPRRLLEYLAWTKIFDAWSKWGHIWIGTSVENKEMAEERIPELLLFKTLHQDIKVWISAEPLLEHIFLPAEWIDKARYGGTGTLDWVVVGGESGPNKRPFDCDWARSMRDACKAANVPFFMKQVDKVIPIPEDLQIREYPKENKF